MLQLLPVLESAGGAEMVSAMLARAGVARVPDGSAMIPEGQAARLHQVLRAEEPERAAELAAEAGRRTAEYILAHRIPWAVKGLLRALPPGLAARALAGAVSRHAWTFAGSGRFAAVDPWTFEIADNPIIRGESSAVPLCHWHAVVFQRLYGALVHRDCRCVETRCGAQGGGLCRFRIWVERSL